jgi:hypothetical protein
VYKRKRADLVATMDATLSALFLGQLKNLHKACLTAFKQQMVEGVKNDKYNFGDIVSNARQRCEDTFMDGTKEALIEGTDWSWQGELRLLKEEVQQVANQFRRDETKKMLNSIEVSVFNCCQTSLITSTISCSENSRRGFQSLSNWH